MKYGNIYFVISLILIFTLNSCSNKPKPLKYLKYNISWNQNKETSVNIEGGGYRIYYSKNDFSNIHASSVDNLDVPYSSGGSSPTQVEFYLPSGEWFVRMTAYSNIGGFNESEPTNSIRVTPGMGRITN